MIFKEPSCHFVSPYKRIYITNSGGKKLKSCNCGQNIVDIFTKWQLFRWQARHPLSIPYISGIFLKLTKILSLKSSSNSWSYSYIHFLVIITFLIYLHFVFCFCQKYIFTYLLIASVSNVLKSNCAKKVKKIVWKFSFWFLLLWKCTETLKMISF